MKKMKLKKASQLEIINSVRRDWGVIDPVTRVKKSKKRYNRKKNKKVQW